MAITKLTFTKVKAGIKASLRYYVHRFEEEGKRITRTLFGPDGKLSKNQAYRTIDKAPWNATFFRMIISPDKKTEDKDHRLNMRDVTEKTMRKLQKIMNSKTPLDYLGVEHRNTDDRHVHAIFFVKGRISPEQLRKIRKAATQASMTEEEWQEYQRNLADNGTRNEERNFVRESIRKSFQGAYRSIRQGKREVKRETSRRTFGGAPSKTASMCPFCMSAITRAGK